MSKDIYFFFIDERPIISFNKYLEEGCGITTIDFGGGEKNFIIFTIADSPEIASKKLLGQIEKNKLKLIPISLDSIKANKLIYKLKLITKLTHLLCSELDKINDIDLSKVKETISRKIDQNTKWNRKFDKLMKDIKEYERNHNKDLKIDILNRCIKLDILPELKNNNPTTIPN